jgi:Tfp pilus assembly protein PilN
MRRLELDFHRRAALARWLRVGLLTLGIIVAGASILHFRALSKEASVWESKLEDLSQLARRKTVSLGGATRDSKAAPEEIKRANVVLDQMTVPWGVLFSELEATSDNDLAFLAIQPDAASRQVRITGVATNLAAVTRFVTRLEAQPHLVGVYLVEHSLSAASPRRPVTFSVVASWEAAP